MGSGGGSGGTPSRPLKKPRAGQSGGGSGGGGGGGGSGGDRCNFSFPADLSAVDPTVLAGVSVDDELVVALIRRHGFDVAVCQRADGEVAGAISNIEDLADLISCLLSGSEYGAVVQEVGRTHCSVHVEPRN